MADRRDTHAETMCLSEETKNRYGGLLFTFVTFTLFIILLSIGLGLRYSNEPQLVIPGTVLACSSAMPGLIFLISFATYGIEYCKGRT